MTATKSEARSRLLRQPKGFRDDFRCPGSKFDDSNSTEAPFTTDPDGYFRVHLSPALPPLVDRLWHPMDLALEQPQVVQAQAQIFILPASCRYVVISDIDDTIMYTGRR